MYETLGDFLSFFFGLLSFPMFAAAASDRSKAGAHHKQAGLRGRLEARRRARGGGHRRAPFRRAVLVPQPPARARPHPLHPVPERVRVRVFLLDTGTPP